MKKDITLADLLEVSRSGLSTPSERIGADRLITQFNTEMLNFYKDPKTIESDEHASNIKKIRAYCDRFGKQVYFKKNTTMEEKIEKRIKQEALAINIVMLYINRRLNYDTDVMEKLISEAVGLIDEYEQNNK